MYVLHLLLCVISFFVCRWVMGLYLIDKTRFDKMRPSDKKSRHRGACRHVDRMQFERPHSVRVG